MTVHYVDAVANDRLDVVVAAIDAAATAGVLVIGTSALSGATGVLVTITLDDPCGTVAGRILTFSGTPIDATGVAAGVAAKAEFRDGDGNVVVNQLTVGVTGSGANIIMDSTAITIGRPVRLLSATITHP